MEILNTKKEKEDYLEKIAKREDWSYEEKFDHLDELLSPILDKEYGVPSINLHPKSPYKTLIIRARLNEDDLFSSFNELSYNPNIEKIIQGRANKKEQSLFYGVTFHPQSNVYKIEDSLITAASECAKDLLEGSFEGERYITFGIWEIIKEINVLDLVFSSKLNGENNEAIRAIGQYYQKPEFINNPGLVDLLEIFSTHYCEEHLDSKYDVSNYIYNKFCNLTELDGLRVPSSKILSQFNIVLKPQTVDNCITLNQVIVGRLTYTDKKNAIIDWTKQIPFSTIPLTNLEGKYIDF